MTPSQTSAEAGWNFDNSYARLPETLFTRQHPGAVKAPEIVICNEDLASALGLDPKALQTPAGAAVLAGNDVPEGADPLAQAYAGHQFGYFNMLGDGRAVLLGEQITPAGGRYDIQLKGSGRTPYSRGGDGRAALGPMLREYIISEGMHGLGIPTTRSLAVTATGQEIQREMSLPGAVLTRVAASHIRVGTFQYTAQWGTPEDLKALADYTINRHYPDAAQSDQPYLSLLREVIRRQASLIAQWQLAGFIHGVMNTDNMALSGETIDYGPCAFMDVYHPATVFSSIDTQGRYAYGNQPYIGAWNLARLAEPLLPLIHDKPEKAAEMAEEEIARFAGWFEENWLHGMRAKLGLFNEEEEDGKLISSLLDLMKEHRADYTNTFRALTLSEETDMDGIEAFSQWLEQWKQRQHRQEESLEAAWRLMRGSNPAVIPRNHRVEEALSAAGQGDLTVMQKLLAVLANPYAYSSEQQPYCMLPGPSTRAYRTYCGT
ncbi:protein adenylyltransferase SelO [Paenibacillus lemnae]|uniref:Protein nucleotidyltransferase YdiU n=1 Tax=Paenibacillus lemnae TaxID=1330551 RepID=A0A848M0R1_PAELE|nr:YdiU family protein [Paenibacillus lemnae]NMO94355.1 YdiU family protein [Paenibacillus lemnae]